MRSGIALLVYASFIYLLFRLEKPLSKGVSRATWIPLIWMSIAASRPISAWIQRTSAGAINTISEGSPTDRAIFFLLIIAGVIILVRRKLPWGELFRRNIWVWLFFLFGLISIVWSEVPFIALKRWVKALGNVIMVLVVLTDINPYRALASVLSRFSFLLLPLSIVLIKYFPDLGRAYHMGLPMYTGVATHKNSLGALCLVSGIYFCWAFLFSLNEKDKVARRYQLLLYSLVGFMIAWLLLGSNSATSIYCMLIALLILLIGRIPSVARVPKRMFLIVVMVIISVTALEVSFGIKDKLLALMGRDATLTTRVPMWHDLISTVQNPFLGRGFESFWLSEGGARIKVTWGLSYNAHNGYLDMYLNLGLVGLFFLIAWIITGLGKILHYQDIDYPVSMLRFACIIAVAIYNYTEATFYGVSLMWVILLFGIMDVPLLAKGKPAVIHLKQE